MRPHPTAKVTAIAIATLALFGMSVQATSQEAGGKPTEAPTPETSTSAEQTDPTTNSDTLLVSKHAIGLLASPSSSASVMYGFPAGRPFRLIGREGSFAKIQDVKSGATGWIDESTLTVAPSVTAAPGPSDSPIGSTPHEPVAVPSEPSRPGRPNCQAPWYFRWRPGRHFWFSQWCIRHALGSVVIY